jgi:uncharacterized protein (DUF2345 family)
VELTPRNKLLLAACGLGVGALLVDKLILGSTGPSPVLAQQSAVPDSTSSAAKSQDSVTGDVAADRMERLAQQLPRIIDQAEAPHVAMAFSVPPVWLSGTESLASSATPQDVIQAQRNQDYRITSVFSAGRGSAVINGVKLSVGQFDARTGLKLISVQQPMRMQPGSAVVEVRGQRMTLTMPVPGLGRNERTEKSGH